MQESQPSRSEDSPLPETRLGKIQNYSLWWLAGTAILLLAAVLVYQYWPNRSTPTPAVTSLNPTPTPTVTPSPTVSASSTATTSPTPSPSASPSPTTQSLSAGQQQLLATFYTAYKNQDRAAVFATMTSAQSSSDQDLYDLLATGKDRYGVPGGPTLFQSQVASAVVQSYNVTSVSTQGSVTTVQVHEKVSSSGVNSERDRVLALVMVGTSYRIDAYHPLSSNQKYTGFIN